MAESTSTTTTTTQDEEEVEYADYYQASGGLTVQMSVCEEGAIVEGKDMGFTKDNPPLSEEEQEEKYGKVLYREYSPDEDELESMKISVIPGMQSPGEPKVIPQPAAQEDLQLLGRAQLRTKAKSLGLNFPADTDRDQMIGAIEKKLKEQAEADAEAAAPEEEEEEETSG